MPHVVVASFASKNASFAGLEIVGSVPGVKDGAKNGKDKKSSGKLSNSCKHRMNFEKVNIGKMVGKVITVDIPLNPSIEKWLKRIKRMN